MADSTRQLNKAMCQRAHGEGGLGKEGGRSGGDRQRERENGWFPPHAKQSTERNTKTHR